jgi:DNA polymerase bacteriophage-type
MISASGDFETKSARDLPKCGVYAYAEDLTTMPTMLWWRLSGMDEPQEWRPGYPDPRPLLAHVARGGEFRAHNANFERQIWNTTLLSRPEYRHWPRLEIRQMNCSMARALAIHLPAELGDLSMALGLGKGKSEEGRALMLKMSRPRKIHPDGRIEWWDSPEMLDQLGKFRCRQDVLDEAAVDAMLPPLSPDERALWELDQKINDRGIACDVTTVQRCVSVLDVAQDRADVKMRDLTAGAVERCSQAQRLVDWLKGRGIPCESIAKGEHDELKLYASCLGDDVARQAIELRAEAGRNSTAKFRRILEFVCADGRLRGMLNYHRALTGRWGGAGPQPHNLPRFEDASGDYLPDVMAAIEIMERFAV